MVEELEADLTSDKRVIDKERVEDRRVGDVGHSGDKNRLGMRVDSEWRGGWERKGAEPIRGGPPGERVGETQRKTMGKER